jgi:hypothetical protein
METGRNNKQLQKEGRYRSVIKTKYERTKELASYISKKKRRKYLNINSKILN